MGFSVICAVARDGAIGVTRDGIPGLPWPRLRHDLRWFQAITTAANPIAMTHAVIDEPLLAREGWHTEGNAVIMGKRTWETLPKRYLASRALYVLTSHPYAATQEMPPGSDVVAAETLEAALNDARKERAPHVFVAGGASVYAEALRHPACERLYLTLVDQEYPEADTHWPWRYCDWEQGVFCDKTVRLLASGGRETRFHPAWTRTACSDWITEPERPRYRFTIWERV